MWSPRNVALASLLLAWTVGTVQASVEFPPPWGYDQGNAYGHWYSPFGTVDEKNPFGATVWSSGGDAGQNIVVGGVGGWGIRNGSGTSVSTDLYLTIPNQQQANWTKHLWIQFDYYVENGAFSLLAVESDAKVTEVVPMTITDLANGWRRVWIIWDLIDQPQSERIHWQFGVVPGGTWALGNVYYSAKCEARAIPEPSMFAVFAGMGGVGLMTALHRRRKSLCGDLAAD